jgi:hypothetical protein
MRTTDHTTRHTSNRLDLPFVGHGNVRRPTRRTRPAESVTDALAGLTVTAPGKNKAARRQAAE